MVLILAILASLTAGAADATPSVFRVRYIQDIDGFDWNLSTDANNAWSYKNIMEGLFEIGYGGEVSPRLAEAYSVSADKLQYTFKLREDVLWSDGESLKSKDFFFAWRRLLHPSSKCRSADLLFDIKGAEDFHLGKLKDFDEVGISVPDAHTIKVTLRNPNPFFLHGLARWETFPIRRDLIIKDEQGWSAPEKVVVLGAYRPVSWEKGSRVVLRRNEGYYGPKPKTEEIQFVMIKDDAEAIEEFRKGKLEHLWVIKPAEAKKALKKAVFRSERDPWTGYLMLNKDHPALNELKRRQAVAEAIDRVKMAKELKLNASTASSFFPPEVFPISKGSAPKFDAKKARKLWGEPGEVPLEIVTGESEYNAAVLSLAKKQLETGLGIKVETKLLSGEEHKQALADRNYAAYFFVIGADYLDPHTFVSAFVSKSPSNRLKWSNEEFDRLVARGVTLPNGLERAKLYSRMLKILEWKDAVVIPLYYLRLNFFLSAKVKKFKRTPIGDVYFRDIEVRRQ